MKTRSRSATSTPSLRTPRFRARSKPPWPDWPKRWPGGVREHGFFARTLHLKLRYSDFSTLTRAHTLAEPTELDHVLIAESRSLFRAAWRHGAPVRLVGVGVSGLEVSAGQMNLLEGERNERARKALAAVDRIRDRYGEQSVKLAGGLSADTPERVHENPVGLPGKQPRRKP